MTRINEEKKFKVEIRFDTTETKLSQNIWFQMSAFQKFGRLDVWIAKARICKVISKKGNRFEYANIFFIISVLKVWCVDLKTGNILGFHSEQCRFWKKLHVWPGITSVDVSH